MRVSFEFFPPKTAKMEASLWEAVRRLEPLNPDFVSVTYGAAGSTRERTHATVARLASETDLRPAAHLTCVGATRAEVDEVVRAYSAAGIDVPIVPGIIPVHNFAQVARFAAQCGATIPDRMARRFEGLDQDTETTHLMAATVAAEQVLGLAEQGVREFHFYTLNRANLVYAICHLLGIRPAGENGSHIAAAFSPALA